jgi:hypothetical protein
MSAEWFYVEDGASKGPVSFDEIANRVRLAKDQSHLLWSAGLVDWTEARELPAFRSVFFPVPPPLPTQRGQQVAEPVQALWSETSENIDTEALTAELHPWRRYFARVLDYMVFSFGEGFAFALFFPKAYAAVTTQVGNNTQVLNLLYIAVSLPLEAFCLHAFGATVGKALYGIRVSQNGAELSYSTALRRAFAVWIKGAGLGIPIVTLATCIVGYQTLTKDGITSWDAKLGLSVEHSKFGPLRWIAVAVTWAAVLGILGWLQSLGTG